ncbi:hypothetical protein N8477_06170 [Candidatus Thioglobus sp.]|nr:hypothetical protein [Candidatus Thioglobus sp.]
MNLYLPVEVKTRELTAKILIAIKTLDFNYNVYIGTKVSVNSLVLNKQHKEGIYLYSGGLDLKSLKAIKEKCDYFVILDEEFGPAISDWDMIGTRISHKTLPMIDGLCVIGQFAQSAAMQQYPEIKNLIHKTGWPRIDLWDEKYKPMYQDKVNQITSKYGSFILFSSDFGLLSESRIIKSKEFLLSSHDYEKTVNLANKITEDSNKNIQEFIDFVATLKKIDNYLDIKIIIRPHPVEEISVWKKMTRGLKNIYVVYEGDSTEWILASSGVIHRGCTSAVHAYFSGIKVGFVSFSKNSVKRANALPFKLSEHIINEKKLIEFCNRKNHACKTLEGHQHYYENTIYSDNEIESSQMIAEYLYTNFKSTEDIDIKISKILALKVILKSHYIHFKSKLKIITFSKNYVTTPISQKIPGGIKLSEVKRIVSFLSNNDISVKRVMKNLMKIQQKNNADNHFSKKSI